MFRTPILFSVTLIVAGAMPLAAQQSTRRAPRAESDSVERHSTRRAPRAESDSVERQLRRLRLRADSLTRVFFNDSEDAEERRRAGEALDETVGALAQLRADDEGTMVMIETRGGMLAPMASPRAAEAMSRALSRSTAPRGWLGIVLSGAAREPWTERGELFIRYLTHPEIVSVEPSSPAERAGLVPSDTLIAYDGKDVTEGDISVTRLLKPNARVLVRIRRDGRTRDVPVRIADVPHRIAVRVDRTYTDERTLTQGPTFRDLRAPLPPFPPSVPRQPTAPSPVGVFAPVAPAAPSGGVAGAQLASITAGLALALHVRSGVLVVAAPPGSPAAESGLAEGDVILKAAGQTVRSVGDLRDIVGAASERGEHGVELEMLRAGQKRKAALRW